MRHRIKKVRVLVSAKMAPYGEIPFGDFPGVYFTVSSVQSTFKLANLMETNTDDQICIYPKCGGIET